MIKEADYDREIGLLLGKWRTEAGMTQQAIADALGLSRKTVVDLENGRVHPKNYTVYRWAGITKHDTERDIRRVLYPTEKSLHGYEEAIERVHTEIDAMHDDEILALDDFLIHDTGGDRRALIHLGLAYLRCTVGDRQNIATMIMHCYEIAQKIHKHQPNRFYPDDEYVHKAIRTAVDAYLNGYDKYYIEK